MDQHDAAMLQVIREIKSYPEYQDKFCEITKQDFDLYEESLSGYTEALIALSISRRL